MKRYCPFQRCAATTYVGGGIAMLGSLNQAVNTMGVSDLMN